ncbi:hypothetical protein WN51_09279 [Melipona quadrifasciata]|uniref:Uncharacterized protein n=1 Tax=Melipona quadrifasciata TaxID=166423 RepID=A0A0N0BIL2_9HYME|nr:hypothetical protein WN51_09279 [Melipona quadrifasciata]
MGLKEIYASMFNPKYTAQNECEAIKKKKVFSDERRMPRKKSHILSIIMLIVRTVHDAVELAKLADKKTAASRSELFGGRGDSAGNENRLRTGRNTKNRQQPRLPTCSVMTFGTPFHTEKSQFVGDNPARLCDVTILVVIAKATYLLPAIDLLRLRTSEEAALKLISFLSFCARKHNGTVVALGLTPFQHRVIKIISLLEGLALPPYPLKALRKSQMNRFLFFRREYVINNPSTRVVGRSVQIVPNSSQQSNSRRANDKSKKNVLETMDD